MGIRQTINEKPGLTTGVTSGIILIALVFIIWQAFGRAGRPAPTGPMKFFYSDDDGKTYFADDATKIPPFDHNGKQAYRAGVFRCGKNPPFVAYLQRFSDEQRKQIEAARARDPRISQSGFMMMAFEQPLDVKKPGAPRWISVTGPKATSSMTDYQRVMTPMCPEGGNNADLRPVSPSDPDNGAVSD